MVLTLLRERPMPGDRLVRSCGRQEVEARAAVSRPHVYSLQQLAEEGLIVGAPQHHGGRECVAYRARPPWPTPSARPVGP